MVEVPKKVSKDYNKEYWKLKALLEKKPDETEEQSKDRNKFRNSQTTLNRVALLVLKGMNCLTARETDEIYFYNPEKGIWIENAHPFISTVCYWLCPEFTKHQIAEIKDKIRRSTYSTSDIFNNNPHIVLKNGVLNLETLEFESEFKSDYYLTNSFPIKYNPNAYPEKISQFLSQILPSESIGLIQELIGYCLLPNYKFHKIFIFTGIGSNGKSTLLNLITQFVGEQNVSHILMQQFEYRFSTEKLRGKLANIAADLPQKALKETGMLKMLSGEDVVFADIKNKNGIEFKNRAKLIFSANAPPAIIGDDSLAIWRRIRTIKFPSIFRGKQCNPNLINELTTEEELSGLLNAALMALIRLEDRGYFEGDEDIERAKTEYILASNNIQAFCEFVLDVEMDGWEWKADVDKAYINFSKFVLQQKPKPISTLTKILPLILDYAEQRKKRKDKKSYRIWHGVKIKDRFKFLFRDKIEAAEAGEARFFVSHEKLRILGFHSYNGDRKMSPQRPQLPHEQNNEEIKE